MQFIIVKWTHADVVQSTLEVKAAVAGVVVPVLVHLEPRVEEDGVVVSPGRRRQE